MTHYLKTKQACCKGSCFHFYRGTSGLHRIFGVCLIMQVNYWVWWYSSIDFSCSLHRQVVIQVRVVHIYTSFPTNIFFTHSRNNNTVSLKISLLAMDVWAQEHEVQHLGCPLGSWAVLETPQTLTHEISQKLLPSNQGFYDVGSGKHKAVWILNAGLCYCYLWQLPDSKWTVGFNRLIIHQCSKGQSKHCGNFSLTYACKNTYLREG